MKRIARIFLSAFSGGLFLLAPGACGHSDRQSAYPVTGKVFYRGQPAEFARVTFVPLEEAAPNAPRPGAQAGKDGSYRLSTFRSYDGAPAGRYAVTIVYPSPARKENDENIGPDLLQGRYADPKTTPLRTEVKKQNNDLEPFQIP